MDVYTKLVTAVGFVSFASSTYIIFNAMLVNT